MVSKAPNINKKGRKFMLSSQLFLFCCAVSFSEDSAQNQSDQKYFFRSTKKDSKMKIKTAVNSLAAIFVILSSVNAVDRNKFRTCQQSSFCRRCRGKNYCYNLEDLKSIMPFPSTGPKKVCADPNFLCQTKN